jgi:RimJ/RimL family protein N-acetyltransferase
MATTVEDPVSATWEQFLDRFGREHDRSSGLRLRPVAPADCDFLLRLRNECEAVRFSASGRTVTPEEHARWFAEHLDRPSSRMWIGQIENERIGQVRIDVTAAVGEVSVAVDPAQRGRGYGVGMIRALLAAVRQDHQVTQLRATVHGANIASLRAFEACGFRRIADDGFTRLGWER